MKSFQAVITLFILLNRSFAQNDIIRNETTILGSIKNHESPAEGMNKIFLRLNRRNSLGQSIMHKRSMNFYEPYWPGGEHVFLQTTKHPGVWSTLEKYFKPFITTKPPPTPPYEGPEMDRYRDCYRDCPLIYSYNYGRVCGFRFNSYKKWVNEFMEFENMCMLEQENCKTPGIMWQAWHRGHCPELSDFKSYPTEATIMKDRALNWQKNLEDSKKHPFYEHRNNRPSVGLKDV